MRLKRFIIEGYTRLMLSGVQRLEWTPTASYQIILGTNGSGKSSLMGEVSPNPPQPGDYIKGGLKHIEFEHEDHEYVLISTMGSATRHSFLRNGIELNEGGTGAVQKELVLRHFRYTKELHDLFIGKTRFSGMSQAERRKWITRLSQADYTFALSLYDRLSKATNDMRSYLKLTKQRLHDEAVALSQMDQAQGIEERVKVLQQELSDLLYHRMPSSQPSISALNELRKAKDQTDVVGHQLVKTAQLIDLKRRDRSLVLLDERVQGLLQEIRASESVLERLKIEFTELEVHLAPLQQSEYKDPTEMRDAHLPLLKKVTALRARVVQFPTLLSADDPIAIRHASEEIIPTVMQLFTSLPNNSDRKFSRENLEKATMLKRSASDRISHDESAVRLLDQRCHAIEHARAETCPECKYVWTPGFNRDELPELLRKREGFVQEIGRCNERIKEADAYLEEADAYMTLYRRWRGMVQQYPRLAPLWTHIQTKQYDTDHPSDHQDVFIDWTTEVRAVSEAFECEQAALKLEKLIEAAVQGEQGALRQRMEALDREITERTSALTQLRQTLQSESFQRDLFQKLESATTAWHDAILNLETTYQNALEAVANECVERDIVKAQSQLGALQHTLRAKEVLSGVIAELNRAVDKAELDYEALALLSQELSPKEGLIAEQLHGFIHCLTAQLNSILSSVWTYELEILPCGMENGELDYQFPLQTGSLGKPSKDVSEGSKSMCEMIDFAFAQTAMLYLDLKNYPLFTDELGASFDDAHRPAINQFISRLMESQRYSQVFMISHYVAGWGSFNDAEYLVLDGRNITVPSIHNTHANLS